MPHTEWHIHGEAMNSIIPRSTLWSSMRSAQQKKAEPTSEEIEQTLLIMALDNEEENVLDALTGNCSETALLTFIERGVNHIQPNVRWQIAELLYRRKPQGFMELLKTLSADDHPYVRKRALNVLNDFRE